MLSAISQRAALTTAIVLCLTGAFFMGVSGLNMCTGVIFTVGVTYGLLYYLRRPRQPVVIAGYDDDDEDELPLRRRRSDDMLLG